MSFFTETNALKTALESEKAKNAAETNALKTELESEKTKSIELNNTIMELKRMVQTLAQQYESIHQECKANSTGRRFVS
jgi:predicted nuclease with TOPRIM domain